MGLDTVEEPYSMKRPESPPPVDGFDTQRPALGDTRFAIRLADVRIEIAGLDPGLRERLEGRFGGFSGEIDASEPAIRVRAYREPREYFLIPPDEPELNPVLTAVEGNVVRYLGYRVGGWFEPDDGEGGLWLARGEYEPAERAIENFLRCAVAWRAMRAGGALIHAASSVRDGVGFLFYGHSGAGKSTLAAADRRGRVVSDDLSLVLPGHDGALELIGSPFRGTYEGGEPVHGRFPVRAAFRLVQAPRARVVEVPREIAFAGLVANLPFVVDAIEVLPWFLDRTREAFASVPLLRLEFRKDDSYWDAIEEAGWLPARS
jgi:hypothetical protein